MYKLPHRFKDESLLATALDPGAAGFGRLEWLGDRVINLAVAIRVFGHADKGAAEMSHAFHSLVNNQELAELGRSQCELDKLTGRQGGRLADIVEAVVGAVLVDSGDIDTAKEFVWAIYGERLANIAPQAWKADPMTTLKELCESNGSEIPRYRVTDNTESGVTVTCSALGKTSSAIAEAAARARSKAAEKLLAMAEADAAPMEPSS